MRVLVIDDEARYRAMLCSALRSLECEPAAAASAREADQWIEENGEPDAILLDLNLPVVDGLAFLAALRKTRETPVIILTGAGSLEAAQAAIERGVTAFLTKPCELAKLDAALAAARAANRRPRDPAVEIVAGAIADPPEIRPPYAASAPPLPCRTSDQAVNDPAAPEASTLDDMICQAILDAVARHGGNRTRAAAELGISRRMLQYRLAAIRQRVRVSHREK